MNNQRITKESPKIYRYRVKELSVITSVIASVIGNVIGRGKIKGIIAIIEKKEGGVQLPLWQSLVYGMEIVINYYVVIKFDYEKE